MRALCECSMTQTIAAIAILLFSRFSSDQHKTTIFVRLCGKEKEWLVSRCDKEREIMWKISRNQFKFIK